MRGAVFFFVNLILLVSVLLAGCSANGKIDEKAAAPPKPDVVEEPDLNIVKVDRPERFALSRRVSGKNCRNYVQLASLIRTSISPFL